MEAKRLKRKTTAIFCITVGTFAVLIWTAIMFADKLPGDKTHLTSLIIHWFSEFIGGILLIIAGISLLNLRSMRKPWLFIALGFYLASIIYNFTNYIDDFMFVPFIIFSILFILTVSIIGWNYNSWKDLVFFTLSFSVNALINISTIPKMESGTSNILVYITLILSLTTLVSFYKRIHYKETIENNPE